VGTRSHLAPCTALRIVPDQLCGSNRPARSRLDLPSSSGNEKPSSTLHCAADRPRPTLWVKADVKKIPLEKHLKKKSMFPSLWRAFCWRLLVFLATSVHKSNNTQLAVAVCRSLVHADALCACCQLQRAANCNLRHPTMSSNSSPHSFLTRLPNATSCSSFTPSSSLSLRLTTRRSGAALRVRTWAAATSFW